MKNLKEFAALLGASLATEVPNVSVLYGAQWLFRRDGQGAPTASRVVVSPCDKSGASGQIGVVRHANRVPPDLGVRRRTPVIEVWAYDASAPSDDGAQTEAAECLLEAVWRHAQAIIRGQRHAAHSEVPGIYQATVTQEVQPTERAHGCKLILSFWIDFSIRDIAPTTTAEPQLEVAAELE